MSEGSATLHRLKTTADQTVRADIIRITAIGLVANLLLSVLKVVAGWLGNSQAVIADGVHSLSDCASDIALILGVFWWSAPPDAEHPHGHGRIEYLVSMGIGLLLFGVATGLVWQGVLGIITPPDVVPGWIAFAAAISSLVVKEILYWRTRAVARRVKSDALMANAWHHRSDALSSVPVAVAIVAAQVNPDWIILDPIAALLVSALVAKAAWDVCVPGASKLVDQAASAEEQRAILAIARQAPRVLEVHKVRTRHVGGGLAVDLHVVIDGELTVKVGHAIGHDVRDRLLRDGPGVVDVVVHIEPDESALKGRSHTAAPR